MKTKGEVWRRRKRVEKYLWKWRGEEEEKE